MSEEMQTPEEALVQAGEGSVGDFVLAWLGSILDDRDVATAMQSATAELCLARAQILLWNATQAEPDHPMLLDREAAAVSLAAVDTNHWLWPNFAEAELAAFDEAWGVARGHLAVGSRPRPLDIEHEVVLVLDYRTVSGPENQYGSLVGKQINDTNKAPAYPVVVRHREEGGYLMASPNGPDHMPVPGWPPTL